jgi:multiple sugar transport system substrate-binding protein
MVLMHNRNTSTFSGVCRNISTILYTIIVIACNSNSKESDDYSLTFWSSNNSHEITFSKQIVSEWNAKYPQYKVDYQPILEGRSSEEVLLAAIVSNTTPDIYSNLWPGVIQQYVEANILVRLDTFPDFDSLLVSRIPVTLRDQFRSPNGNYYQVPWKSNPIVLYYNKKYFDDNGIKVPLKTYSDFFQAAEKLTIDLDGDGYYDRWMMYVDHNVEWWHRFFDFYTFFIAASEGQSLLKDERVAFNTVPGYAVFDFFQKGFKEGFFPNAIFQGDVFVQGQVAVHVSGPWNIAQVEKFKPEGFEYGFMPIPVPDSYSGENYTFGDPKSIGIFKTTKHAEIAWKFVKFLVSRNSDKHLLEITNQFPIRDNLLNDNLYDDYFETSPQYTFFADLIPNTVGFDHTGTLQEMFDIISQEFDATCVHAIKNPQQGIEDATLRCNNLLLREKY